MCIVDRLDIVKIGPPVLDIPPLSSGNQPVMAVRPCQRRHSRLYLIVMRLFLVSAGESQMGEQNARTSITVSKLNAVPFHSMNSPVCPPVNKRRPSGVHRTTVIGFFDFPID